MFNTTNTNYEQPLSLARLLSLAFMLVLASACTSVYYNTLERFGIEKREILVDRVEDARDAQEDAKEQFTTALDRFRSVVDFESGELEDLYDSLNRDFERSQERAETVRERIAAVEEVSELLFEDWEEELDQYTSETLRASSAESLRNTRERYEELIGSMREAEQRMDPVLAAFQDQVLFLRHNLNSQAIASLRAEAVEMEEEISELIAAMEAAIAESNAFIDEMGLT